MPCPITIVLFLHLRIASSQVPSNATAITMHLSGNSLDLKSMSNLTNLRYIIISQMGSRILKLSDFIIFPKLAKLRIDNAESQIKLEKLELTGMCNHFLNHWLFVELSRPCSSFLFVWEVPACLFGFLVPRLLQYTVICRLLQYTVILRLLQYTEVKTKTVFIFFFLNVVVWSKIPVDMLK